MSGLRAVLMRRIPSDEGIQADLMLIEPNGDEYPARCLCLHDGMTKITGETEAMAYLNEKFGSQTVWAVSRKVTLGLEA